MGGESQWKSAHGEARGSWVLGWQEKPWRRSAAMDPETGRWPIILARRAPDRLEIPS